MTGWRTVPLGSFIELKRGYDLPSRARRPGPYRLVTSSGPSEFISEAKVRGPGVVTGRYGTVGKVFYVSDDFWPLNTTLYVRDFKGNDPRFVYYFLHGINWRKFNDKSGVPGINRNDVHREVVAVPPPDIQKGIAHTLAALDDKIAINRRASGTLEAMAQAIFRDWFVNFGPIHRRRSGSTDPLAIMGNVTRDRTKASGLAALFPDEIEEDGRPAGWKAFPLNALANHIKGTVDPARRPNDLFEHYSLPAFDSGAYPVEELGTKIRSNKTPVPPGAILLSKLNPEISRVWIPNVSAGIEQIASTEFLVLLPKTGVSREVLYTLFCDPAFRQTLEGMVTGTSKSHQRISPAALLKTRPLVGSLECFAAFGHLVEPLLRRVLDLRAESRTLAEIRDYLLPRLMSGALRVSDVALRSQVP